jgi:hypothetical protein
MHLNRGKYGEFNWLILALLIVSFVPACTQHLSETPLSLQLRSDPECIAPCWRSIRSGITTRSELDNMVRSTPARFNQFGCSDIEGWSRCTWIESSDTVQITVMLDFQDGIVKRTLLYSGKWLGFVKGIRDESFSISYGFAEARDSQLGTVDEVIGILGYPDSYYAEVFDGHYGMGSTLTLFYKNKGIIVEGPVGDYRSLPESCEVEITSNLPVVSIQYYDGADNFPPHSFDEERHAWIGFGAIKASCLLE